MSDWEGDPIWFFDSDGQGGFAECGDSRSYETLFSQCLLTSKPTASFTFRRHTYTIDFQNMTQTNLQYSTSRRIMRLPEPEYLPLDPRNVTTTTTPRSPKNPLKVSQDQIWSTLLHNQSKIIATLNSSEQSVLNSYISHLTTRTKAKSGVLVPTLGQTPHPLYSQLQAIVKQLPTDLTFAPIAIKTIPLDKFPTSDDFFAYGTPIMSMDHYFAWRLAKHNGTQGSFPYSHFISTSGPTNVPFSPAAADLTNGMGNDSDIDCYVCLGQAWDPTTTTTTTTAYSTDPVFPDSGDDAIIQLECSHIIHAGCLKDQLTTSSGTCGVCKETIIHRPGPQPCGSCVVSYQPQTHCAGVSHMDGSIVIQFNMQGGVQDSRHANPGKGYGGENRVHYMPASLYNLRILLPLIIKAFALRHLFTIGQSYARNTDGVITYSSIHLKSAPSGGLHSFPDPAFEETMTNEILDAGVKIFMNDFGL